MSKVVKKARRFIFNDAKEAERFLSETKINPAVAYAQHPLIGDGSLVRVMNEVLVTYNNTPRALTFLEKRASELGGYDLPLHP